MGNYIIIGLVIVIIYFAVRSVIKRGKNGCCGGGSCSVHEVKAEDQDLSHYPFKAVVTVEDMHCECKTECQSKRRGIPFYGNPSIIMVK